MNSKRIRSIDIMRGIAIVVMLVIHVANNWLNDDSRWFLIIMRIFSNTMAVNGFIFVSGLSFGFAWDRNASKGMQLKENSYKSLSRTILIGIISLVYNITTIFIQGYELKEIWFWYILQTIAFLRLINIFIIKLSVKKRFILALLIIILSPLILELLSGNNLVIKGFYFILYNSLDSNSPIFFLPFFIIGTIFGEKISNLNNCNSNDRVDMKNIIKNWIIIGLIFILIGILSGSKLVDKEIGWNYIDTLNLHPNINITKIPLVFVRASYSWSFYTIGVEIILLSILYYYFDDRKIMTNKKFEPFERYGRYSLTIYLIHYIYFAKRFYFDYTTIIFPTILLLILIWIFVKLLDYYGKGKYSVEYIIGYYGNFLYNKYFNTTIEVKNKNST